jgi:hypothetical protein
MKQLLLCTLLLASFKTLAQENISTETPAKESKLGILPFVEINYSSAKVGERSGPMTGYSLGAEYTVYKTAALSSNSKFTLNSFTKDDSSLFYTNKVETLSFLLGQTVNYDTQLFGYALQPYVQVEVGYAKSQAKSSFNFMRYSNEETTGSDGGFISEASVGTRAMLASSFVPYVVAGYRYYEISSADFSSVYGSFGVGYQF